MAINNSSLTWSVSERTSLVGTVFSLEGIFQFVYSPLSHVERGMTGIMEECARRRMTNVG